MYTWKSKFIPARTSAAVITFADSLQELFLPTGLVNLISQTRKVIIRIFMLILFSHHKLTPGVTVIQNTLCDLAALQILLTYLP